MNKKFSTLLAALAVMGSFSANAQTDAKLQQVKLDGKVLSVVKSEVSEADSLVLADASTDVMSVDYKKSLWKLTEGLVDNTTTSVWTLTNWATGKALSLDLAKGNSTIVAGGQAQWLISKAGEISVIKGGKTYVVAYDAEKGIQVGKDLTAASKFEFARPADIASLSADQINGLYGTASVLTFDKKLEGNPIDGVAFTAVQTATEGYVNVRFADGKFLVVDTTKWANSVNDNEYWKLTTDALPANEAETGDKVDALAGDAVLTNGRTSATYQFALSLNIADGYKLTVKPNAVPAYKGEAGKEGKQVKMAYGNEPATRNLSFGKFASSTEVLTATKAEGDALKDAVATFGTVKAPDALDTDYTYYVQDYNTYASVGVKNKAYKKYAYLNCEGNKDANKETVAIPAYMFALSETGALQNMMNTEKAYKGAITLIDEAEGLYAFGLDTLKLTKGPKVEDARAMAYKVVTTADEVNGALSFRLVSVLADDLYIVDKKGTLYVENSTLADAQKFKVVKNDPVKTVVGSNEVVMPTYKLTNRLGNKYLALTEGVFTMVDKGEPAVVAFLSTNGENQYKIVVLGETKTAVTANAASGILEEGGLCQDANVIFEFATKDAPAYGAPKVGHVQITTTEDDGKVIANQKDGFAALKAVGQSLVAGEVYTNDTLTMWLDTASLQFNEAMPLYYLSTKTFTPEAETRNYLVNPQNISKALQAAQKDDVYDFSKVSLAEESYRAAFMPAAVCGQDSLALGGDTINVYQLNPAAIAFEVAAEVNDNTYRIVSKLQDVNAEYDSEVEGSLPYTEHGDMYLAQLNNVLYWTLDGNQAELFVINRAATPTSNEEVAVEGVQVVAGNGVVTVQGAAGETVTVSNILGQTLAQQVLTSDNATIAVPAGVVVVKVANQAVKVVVK